MMEVALLMMMGLVQDKLEEGSIPSSRRVEGQPKELVAVLGEPLEKTDPIHQECGVAFGPQGRTLALTLSHTPLQIWDLSGTEPKLQGKVERPRGAGFLWLSRDGGTVAVGGPENVLWDLTAAPPRERARFKGGSATKGLAFSPDGKTLAAADHDKTVRLWNIGGNPPKETATLTGHGHYVTRVAFSPDGKVLASGSRDTVTENPKKVGAYHYYYLYGLERAGILYGTEFFGKREWYPEGAAYLLDAQGADGSWPPSPGGENAQVNTCFAILFLRRATRPLQGVASVDRVHK